MYDFSKILKIQPSEYQRMSVSSIEFFIQQISKDLKDKDPFITPSPRLL